MFLHLLFPPPPSLLGGYLPPLIFRFLLGGLRPSRTSPPAGRPSASQTTRARFRGATPDLPWGRLLPPSHPPPPVGCRPPEPPRFWGAIASQTTHRRLGAFESSRPRTGFRRSRYHFWNLREKCNRLVVSRAFGLVCEPVSGRWGGYYPGDFPSTPGTAVGGGG